MPPNTTPTTAKSDQFNQLVERLGTATNILITVSANPSVDQLAACIGLTVALNKKGKHATAVFSGKVPSTLEFLQPEKTIETDTNSLRDFIISLDKEKADKLRYKVEDDFVKIFITPYRTSIDDTDLTFSQGDFNIDLIITLGVHERAHLDDAIIAHGRILHDATVASLNVDTISDTGSINWVEVGASSLCEMVTDLVMEVDRDLIDAQIATALLTGMVAETDRFGNEKVRPHTMSVSGILMASGASTQLIANKLKEPEAEPEPEVTEETPEEAPHEEIPLVVEEPEVPAEPTPEPAPEEPAPEPEPEPEPEAAPEPEPAPKSEDGSIQIEHEDDDIHIDETGKLRAVKELEEAQAALEAETQRAADEAQRVAQEESDADDAAAIPEAPAPAEEPKSDDQRSLVLDPPQLGGQLTANTIAESQQYTPAIDSLGVQDAQPLLDRSVVDQLPPEIVPLSPEPESESPQTLSDLEQAVNSAHVAAGAAVESAEVPVEDNVPPPPPLDDARSAVEEAMGAVDNYRPEPINALGATPIDLNLGHDEPEDKSNDNPPPAVPPPMMPPGV